MGEETTVRVAVRVRPMSASEMEECGKVVFVEKEGDVRVVSAGSNAAGGDNSALSSNDVRQFTFDHAFGPDCKQEDVYTCVYPIVKNFAEGYNATVLAYGQTGSGKTYTMGMDYGNGNSSSVSSTTGIIPRAINNIFKLVRLDENVSEVSFKVCFIELRNEDVVDLLQCSSTTGNSKGQYQIRELSNGTITISGVKEEAVSSPGEVLDILKRGSGFRSTASTNMNAQSSRSHAIFTLLMEKKSQVKLEQYCTDDGTIVPEEYQTKTVNAKFHFVDLAGSERLKRTMATGERAKEGISINSGLLALGNVISVLGDESKKSSCKHVPYRDSKLTRLLQDSLGGNSKTIMIACASPSSSNVNETTNTLKYANRARNIKNVPIVNKTNSSSYLKQLQLENQSLKERMAVLEMKSTGTSGNSQVALIKLQSLYSSFCSNICNFFSKLPRFYYEDSKGFMETIQKCSEILIDLIGEDANMDSTEWNMFVTKYSESSSEDFDAKVCPPSDGGNAEDAKLLDSLTSLLSKKSRDEGPENDEMNENEEEAEIVEQLSYCIKNKEQQIENLQQEVKRNEELASAYEVEISKMGVRIEEIEKERDAVAKKSGKSLSSRKNDDALKKLAMYEEQLKKSKEEMSILRSKRAELQKVLRKTKQNEPLIENLKNQLSQFKTQKVLLMKKMRLESAKYAKDVSEQKKQRAQLQRQLMKEKARTSKLENENQKQKNVLKRRMEEIQIAQKRLKKSHKSMISNQHPEKSIEKKGKSSETSSKSASTASKHPESDLDFVKDCQKIQNDMENMLQVEELVKTRQDIISRKAKLETERNSLDVNSTSYKVDLEYLEAEIECLEVQSRTTEGDIAVANKSKTESYKKTINEMSEAGSKAMLEALFLSTIDLRVEGKSKALEVEHLQKSTEQLSKRILSQHEDSRKCNILEKQNESLKERVSTLEQECERRVKTGSEAIDFEKRISQLETVEKKMKIEHQEEVNSLFLENEKLRLKVEKLEKERLEGSRADDKCALLEKNNQKLAKEVEILEEEYERVYSDKDRQKEALETELLELQKSEAEGKAKYESELESILKEKNALQTRIVRLEEVLDSRNCTKNEDFEELQKQNNKLLSQLEQVRSEKVTMSLQKKELENTVSLLSTKLSSGLFRSDDISDSPLDRSFINGRDSDPEILVEDSPFDGLINAEKTSYSKDIVKATPLTVLEKPSKRIRVEKEAGSAACEINETFVFSNKPEAETEISSSSDAVQNENKPRLYNLRRKKTLEKEKKMEEDDMKPTKLVFKNKPLRNTPPVKPVRATRNTRKLFKANSKPIAKLH
eukprot:Nk52_evm29s554 gene=Nk52_evmTU29s554